MRTIYCTLYLYDYFDLLYQNDDDLLDRALHSLKYKSFARKYL